MRNFVITVNGKSYQVAVEEVGAVASAPVQPVSMPAPAAVPAAPQAAPAPAAQPAPAPAPAPVAAPAAPKATPANGEKVLSPFPGSSRNCSWRKARRSKRISPYSFSKP